MLRNPLEVPNSTWTRNLARQVSPHKASQARCVAFMMVRSSLGLAGGPSQRQAHLRQITWPLAQPSSTALGAPKAALPSSKPGCLFPWGCWEGGVGIQTAGSHRGQTSWACPGLCCVLLGPCPPATAGPPVPGAPRLLRESSPISLQGSRHGERRAAPEPQRKWRPPPSALFLRPLGRERPLQGAPPAHFQTQQRTRPPRCAALPLSSLPPPAAALPSPGAR